MSFPPPQYADIDLVRKLAGNIDSSDLTDADITSAILYSDRHVDSETAKSGVGWTVTDPSYQLVVEASSYFAASYIIDRYFDNELKSDRHYQKALDLCMSIRESSPGSLILATQQYKTFPLNPQGKIYRSLPGSADASNRQALSGDDSDTISP